jgi:hypothetical protein
MLNNQANNHARRGHLIFCHKLTVLLYGREMGSIELADDPYTCVTMGAAVSDRFCFVPPYFPWG